MPMLIATRGVSGCGKSHWARQEAARLRAAGRRVATVERDVLRDMLGVDRHGDVEGERLVSAGQRALVLGWLATGTDVLVPDTNTRAEWVATLAALAAEAGAGFELVDFSHVPLEVCLAHDALRPPRAPGRCAGAQVGADGLREQYWQLQEYLAAEARQRPAQLLACPAATVRYKDS